MNKLIEDLLSFISAIIVGVAINELYSEISKIAADHNIEFWYALVKNFKLIIVRPTPYVLISSFLLPMIVMRMQNSRAKKAEYIFRQYKAERLKLLADKSLANLKAGDLKKHHELDELINNTYTKE